jgi:hypothetical protein
MICGRDGKANCSEMKCGGEATTHNLRRSSLSRYSVAGTADSVDRSLFQGGHTKCASIVENSFRMFARILVIFIPVGNQ